MTIVILFAYFSKLSLSLNFDTMHRVLLDDKLQAEFDKTGVVKVPFFDMETVEELRKFHHDQKPNERYNVQDKSVSYHFSFLDSNREYKRKVFEHLSKVFQPVLDKYMAQYEPLVINFVNKETGLGEVPVHQNWDFVNEKEFTSVSVWVPLVDVGLNSGALEFIPGTHRTFRNIHRSPSIPWFFKRYVEDLKRDYLKPITVKAGEALIFDDSIIHYSKPNQAGYDRLVIQVIAKPKAAQAVHYYCKKSLFKKEYHELFVDQDFFLNFNFHITEEPKEVKSSRVVEYKHPDINYRKFKEIMAEAGLETA